MRKIKRIISVFMSMLLMLSFIPFNVYADSLVVSYDDMSINEEALSVIKEIEAYLESHGTSIEEELEKLAKKYEERLLEVERNEFRIENVKEKEERIDTLQNLIDLTRSAIEDYKYYLNLDSVELEAKNGTITPNSNPITNALIHVTIAAAISYFNFNNYDLSAELLVYARDGSRNLYNPEYGYIVTYTNTFRNIMRDKNSFELGQSARFPGGSSTDEMDAFYAIHRFTYDKYGDYIRIFDYYDYEGPDEFDGIVGSVVNIMREAERRGILIPYNIMIEAYA